MNWQYVEIERLARIRHEQLLCEADHRRLSDSANPRRSTSAIGLGQRVRARFARKSS
jgi:hypothetical protein